MLPVHETEVIPTLFYEVGCIEPSKMRGASLGGIL
jgi:hypothetical protein